MLRDIIEIDEDLCNGCGLCVQGCHEGALQIIDGKAKLINEVFCDGLGACVGECPVGALRITRKEVPPYDEVETLERMLKGQSPLPTVLAHLRHLKQSGAEQFYQEGLAYLRQHRPHFPFAELEGPSAGAPSGSAAPLASGAPLTGGCPGSMARELTPQAKIQNSSAGSAELPVAEQPSALAQWPIQLGLIMPSNPLFSGADVLIAADCCAYAYGAFHRDFMQGRKVLIGCPKLDTAEQLQMYEQKVGMLISQATLASLTVCIMEVPCCSGLALLVQRAWEAAKGGQRPPLEIVVVGINGQVQQRQQFYA